MFRFRLCDMIWFISLTCLAIGMIVDRSNHSREIKNLQNEVEKLADGLAAEQKFIPSYADPDIYVLESTTGRINY